VIRKTLGTAARLLSSARLATLLLAFVGVWSMLASLVPQGAATESRVAAWASAHPAAESVVRLVGLHRAFSAPLFSLIILVLAISTAFCAWQRTKVALRRSRALSTVAAADGESLAARHDLAVPVDAKLDESQVLEIAAETLGRLGIRARRQDTTLRAASPAWTAWGSPVFHWALLGLIVAMLLGNMLRSSGQMGLVVGQAKADEPASYGTLAEGPLHSWGRVQRVIRVDDFDVNFRTGDVDRGASPTVSVLNAAGEVVKTQRVYPNKTLKTGSLTIYPYDYGLSATVSLADPGGAELARSTQLVDFSTEATSGTAPVGYLTIGDETGNAALNVFVSVPLDRTEAGLVARLPETPKARVVLTSPDGTPILDRVLLPGEALDLPVGGTLRLLDVGYYARLQLVDDPSIPVLYTGVIVALIGLGVATLAQQQLVTAAVVQTEGARSLAVRLRLWRNVTTTRTEIESELAVALGGADDGETA